MFRALPRPSSGAYNCISSLWFYRWSVAVAAFLVVVGPTTTNNAALRNKSEIIFTIKLICVIFNTEPLNVCSNPQTRCSGCKFMHSEDTFFVFFCALLWAGIAQSLWLLATAWTARWSNPGGGEIFSTCLEQPWSPPTLLRYRYRVYPGVKSVGAWRWPPTPRPSAEVKERVELYSYSNSGPSWPVLGCILPLPIT